MLRFKQYDYLPGTSDSSSVLLRPSGDFGGENTFLGGPPLPLTFLDTGGLRLVTLVAELKALDALELLVTLELGDDTALAADIVLTRSGGTGGIAGTTREVTFGKGRARDPDGVGGVDFVLSPDIDARRGRAFVGVPVVDIVRIRVERVPLGFSPGADEDVGSAFLSKGAGKGFPGKRRRLTVAVLDGVFAGLSPGLSFRYYINSEIACHSTCKVCVTCTDIQITLEPSPLTVIGFAGLSRARRSMIKTFPFSVPTYKAAPSAEKHMDVTET